MKEFSFGDWNNVILHRAGKKVSRLLAVQFIGCKSKSGFQHSPFLLQHFLWDYVLNVLNFVMNFVRLMCDTVCQLQEENEGQCLLFVLGPLLWQQLLEVLTFESGLCKSEKTWWFMDLSRRVHNSMECPAFYRMWIKVGDSNGLLRGYILWPVFTVDLVNFNSETVHN